MKQLLMIVLMSLFFGISAAIPNNTDAISDWSASTLQVCIYLASYTYHGLKCHVQNLIKERIGRNKFHILIALVPPPPPTTTTT